MVVEPNVGLEITKGVGKVVVQVLELHGILELVSCNHDREVHKVGKVVTKERRKAKSAEPGICIRFSCRDNSSFKLNQ